MQRIDSEQELDAAITTNHLLVILLHTQSAVISARAHHEVAMSELDHAHIPYFELHTSKTRVDATANRSLIDALARHVGEHHDAPHVYVIKKGKLKWHAPHGGIRKEAIAAALR